MSKKFNIKKGVKNNYKNMTTFVVLKLTDNDSKRISQIATERNINEDIVENEYSEFLKKIELVQLQSLKVDFNIDKSLLIRKCKLYQLSELETKVLIFYFCDKLKRWQIGNLLNYSEETISRIKEKALQKMQND